MRVFPAFHDLAGRRVVIAGAGKAVFHKARLVEAAGAEVIFAGVGAAAEDFAGAALAFVAGADDAEAARLAGLARAARVPVNVVDRPELSDFITPAIVDRGDIIVAVSTGGAAPVLARRIREKIEALLPSRLSALGRFARTFRGAVAARVDFRSRRAFWESFFDGPIATQVLAGDERGASEAMIAAINRPQPDNKTGVVHIVGAGPGDPDLLTLKALRLLQSADVILYDRLVGEGVLAMARRDALLLYVGKAKADHSVPQEEIERRLIEHARAGKIVVRLKGGDPFIFGRGGEEFDAVRAAGIPVFVTPGITAAIGCAAAAELPLTHRDFSQAVTFVTGHGRDDGEPDLDWAALARLGHTLVVYMGAGRAAAIAGNLIANGRGASTPVAVIEKGTTAEEKILKGRLDELGALVREGGIEGPALLIIGEVAAKANGLQLAEIATHERRAA